MESGRKFRAMTDIGLENSHWTLSDGVDTYGPDGRMKVAGDVAGDRQQRIIVKFAPGKRVDVEISNHESSAHSVILVVCM